MSAAAKKGRKGQLMKRIRNKLKRARKIPARVLLRMRGYDNSQAILLEPFNAIYFQVPKVASSTIKKRLKHELGLSGLAPHTTLFPAPDTDKLEAGLYADYFKFGFVRNPWARIVSCYQSKIARNRNINGTLKNWCLFYLLRGSANSARNRAAALPMLDASLSFEQFVEAVTKIPDDCADKHFRSQYRFLCDANGELQIDYLGHLETFNDDFPAVAGQIGITVEEPKDRVRKRKRRGSYKDFYTRETWEMVAQRYRRDIELLGYTECRL